MYGGCNWRSAADAGCSCGTGGMNRCGLNGSGCVIGAASGAATLTGLNVYQMRWSLVVVIVAYQISVLAIRIMSIPKTWTGSRVWSTTPYERYQQTRGIALNG